MRPLAKIKMKDYIRRYHHCDPSELPRIKKMPFVRLLADVYDYSAEEIARFFGCSKSTAYRLVSDARFFKKLSSIALGEEKRIADYILYNVNYHG